LCAVLQDSPAWDDQPVESVTLIPMGAARLRISAFPTVSESPDAHRWHAPVIPKKPVYKASASHSSSGDTVDALSDGMEPKNSSDQDIPRFTWWDHRGTTEWVQYDFLEPKEVSSVDVYWFDDTGGGQCRVPKSWRLLYQDGGEWKSVPGTEPAAATKDQWNSMSFPVVKTSALRIEAELQPGFSGGILEWRLK
jgi:hypothetical protein